MIIPAQELLDNLVWMKHTADRLDVTLYRSTEVFLRSNTARLLGQLHYHISNPEDYDEALRHRCDTEESLTRLSKDVREAIQDYFCSAKVINAGNETEHVTSLPTHWSEDVARLQEALLSDFEGKGIVVNAILPLTLESGDLRSIRSIPYSDSTECATIESMLSRRA